MQVRNYESRAAVLERQTQQNALDHARIVAELKHKIILVQNKLDERASLIADF